MADMPDTAQTFSCCGGFTLMGKQKLPAYQLIRKVKETDRLLALKNELNKIKIKN